MASDEVIGQGLSEAPSTEPFVIAGEPVATPDYLIPKMDQYPVADPAYYKQLFIHDTRPASKKLSELAGVVDPFADVDDASLAAQGPVEGALLTYEQAWRQEGLALGRLLHSLCLAPGEVTQIAVVDFNRRVSGLSTEVAAQDDAVSSGNTIISADQEVKNATAKQVESGSSSQLSHSTQAQGSVSGGGLFVSGSASTASNFGMGVATASSASSSAIGAESARALHQTTVAKSQATRSRRATQIRETSESETQTATTRVLANYNHMHSLTMMFFEVVQIFKLSTRVVDAERVIFVPMKELDFTEEAVRANAQRLLAVLRETGQSDHFDDLIAFLNSETATLHSQLELDREYMKAVINELISDVDWDDDLPVGLEPPNDRQIMRFFKFVDKKTELELEKVARRGDAISEQDRRKIDEYLEKIVRGKEAFAKFRKSRNALDAALYIVQFFKANQLWFSQQLWMRMDAARIQRLVAKHTFKGTPLANLLDPRPLGVYGQYVAFRLPHASRTGDASFARRYVQKAGDDSVPEDYVAMPSGGVFGEAVLGQSVAAEKIDLTRFWNWQDSPIPILPPTMQPLGLGSRAQGVDFTRVELDEALAKLQDVIPPERGDLSALIGKIKEGFSDMSGSQGLGSTLAAQIAAAQAGATDAGEQSLAVQKNLQDFAVGIANSEVGKAATAALLAKGTGGATVMGGVLARGASTAGRGAANGAGTPTDGPATTDGSD
ncbi:MAG: hypothetical protein AAFX81_01950 [Pseudomonadota bacterium]